MPRLNAEVFLIAPLRTPIGRFGGTLAAVTAAEQGTHIATLCPMMLQRV